jgi:hypothetical protein
MANQLEPHAEWQRLYERYHAMTDDELLKLAADIDDLTEIAGDVLRREIKDRRLEVEKSGADVVDRTSGPKPEVPGLVELTVLSDAIAAQAVCSLLEEQDVEFEVRDFSLPRYGFKATGYGPPVQLGFFVDAADLQKAKAILREKMGLFPLQEVEVADAPVDDGTTSVLGYFARHEDAEEIEKVLDDARIWHRVVTNPEGAVDAENLFALEVREIDLMRAGELVERAMNMPEA